MVEHSRGQAQAALRDLASQCGRPGIGAPQYDGKAAGAGIGHERAVGLFRWDMRPQAGGLSGHFHKTFSESFYILDGKVRLYNGEMWVEATAGDFFHVPAGGIHGFHNDSDADASMMIVFAPGAPRESYFEALAELGATGRTLSADEWTELYAQHDQYMVRPIVALAATTGER